MLAVAAVVFVLPPIEAIAATVAAVAADSALAFVAAPALNKVSTLTD